MKAALFVVASALLVASCLAVRPESEYESLWGDFVAKYGKTYSTIEAVHRYTIFKQKVDFVDNHNSGNHTFRVAINKFADLSNVEFNALYNKFRPSMKQPSGKIFKPTNFAAVPSSWDWRTKGAVTAVKNQGQCGSCWSFSTTGSVEGCHFLTTGQLVSLSEQNLVDCSGNQGNQGCDGGLMDDAFKYIIQNKGIDTESSYPYTAQDGSCHYAKSECGSTVTSFTDVESGSESALLTAVYAAPISVAIDASQDSFQMYSSGVYYEPDCSSTQLDHGVLAVGFGTDGGQDYWLVKNSWGTDWGMDGYIEMARNRNNNCGIATMASFPKGCGKCQ